MTRSPVVDGIHGMRSTHGGFSGRAVKRFHVKAGR
jgi:hypothetical protein